MSDFKASNVWFSNILFKNDIKIYLLCGEIESNDL